MTSTQRVEKCGLVLSALICSFLMAAGARMAAKGSGDTGVPIHQGVVTGARWVTPNAAEIDASTDPFGRVFCGSARIKRTLIFRIETASHYFDLFKQCGANVDFWRNYENLQIGQRVVFVIHTTTEPVHSKRCAELAPEAELRSPSLSDRKSRFYQSQCQQKIELADIEHGNGMREFRVLESGPKSKAGIGRGGEGWISFLQGAVTAIGWTKDLHSLVGADLTTDELGRVSCKEATVERVPIYRIETGSHYFDLEDGCDEADLMDLDEAWGKYARLKIGESVTFHLEENPNWGPVKRDTAQRIAWVDQGDRVLEFGVAESGLKSALPPGPSFDEPESGGSPYNKCGAVVGYPVAIYKPNPSYSEQARKARKSGAVVLSFVVAPQGNVTREKVVKSLGTGLDQNALETVKTWKFKPATCNGVPFPMALKVEVSFREH